MSYRGEEGSFNSDIDASSGGQLFFCNPSGLCTFFILGVTEGTTAYGYPFDDNTQSPGNLAISSPGQSNSDLMPDGDNLGYKKMVKNIKERFF